jgi:hypothetical protein
MEGMAALLGSLPGTAVPSAESAAQAVAASLEVRCGWGSARNRARRMDHC